MIDTCKEKMRHIYSFSSINGKTKLRVVQNVNIGVYGSDTATANHMQFRFRRFRNFDVKDAPRSLKELSIILVK